MDAERSREPSSHSSGMGEATMEHRLSATVFLTRSHGDNGRWAVRLGRHALEKISRAP